MNSDWLYCGGGEEFGRGLEHLELGLLEALLVRALIGEDSLGFALHNIIGSRVYYLKPTWGTGSGTTW